jgi:hypothetical protein
MVSQQEHQEVLDRFKSWGRRATIGYLIALVGIGFAVFTSHQASEEALSAGKDKGSVVRSVLCKRLTDADTQLYTYLKEHKAGSGGFRALLTPDIIHKSLSNNAKERGELNYLPHPKPKGVCTSKITPEPPPVKVV